MSNRPVAGRCGAKASGGPHIPTRAVTKRPEHTSPSVAFLQASGAKRSMRCSTCAPQMGGTGAYGVRRWRLRPAGRCSRTAVLPVARAGPRPAGASPPGGCRRRRPAEPAPWLVAAFGPTTAADIEWAAMAGWAGLLENPESWRRRARERPEQRRPTSTSGHSGSGSGVVIRDARQEAKDCIVQWIAMQPDDVVDDAVDGEVGRGEVRLRPMLLRPAWHGADLPHLEGWPLADHAALVPWHVGRASGRVGIDRRHRRVPFR